MEQKRHLMECQVRAFGDRGLTFTASTERVARDGDIVEVSGWDVAEFKKNPVFLWSHNHGSPPIGKVVDIRKVTKGEKRLEVDVEFAGFEQMHELAEQVFLLYRDGFLKSVSVGFIPRAYKEVSPKKKEELGLGQYGRVISKAELLEVSAVSVPADPGALMQASATPEVRDALIAVRGIASEEDQAGLLQIEEALSEPPETEGTDSDAITIEMVQDAVRSIVREEIKTLGAEITAQLRAMTGPRKQSRQAPRSPTLEQPTEDDIDGDAWGIGQAIKDRRR